MSLDKGNQGDLIKRLAKIINKGDPESSELLSVLDQIKHQGLPESLKENINTPKDNNEEEFFESSSRSDEYSEDSDSSYSCIFK